MLRLREADDTLMNEVRIGLMATPKRLPSVLFYDAEGSALFERITELPEYYPTRTERSILREHAGDMIAAAGLDMDLVELGSGTATKTHLLIQAILAHQTHGRYAPIDVSAAALEHARSALAVSFPELELQPTHASYIEGLASLPHHGRRRLVLFLGSTLGNFEPAEATQFLTFVRRSLRPGDALLIGLDQAKDPGILVPAYDDAQGVTARFNLNVLARLNREWGGNFDLDHFHHVALWNQSESRIEMHLESIQDCSVSIASLGLEITFRKGERIHTENSTKFRPGMGEAILQDAGWALERTWMDAKGWFALHLARC